MSVIRALRERVQPHEERSNNFPAFYGLDSWGWMRNAYTMGGNVHQALRNAASWACISVLVRTVSRTPLDVVRSDGEIRVPVVPQPKIVANPSGLVRPGVWRSQLAFAMTTDGNGFGRVVATDQRQFPTQIELLDSCTVGQREVVDGVARVSVNGGAPERLWPFGPIWHVPGTLVAPGTPFAFSPVQYAAKTIGTSISVEDFSNGFFTSGGHPTSVIYSEKSLNEKQSQDVKDAYLRATQRRSTDDNREPVVMGAGLKIEQLQSDPNETQFIDLARFEVEQACRFWGVPPSMVYAAVSGQNVTYANVTQADLHFLKHSVDDYFDRIEDAIYDLLPRPQFARFNRNAVLRADVMARYQAYQIALQNKFATVNEVRALEDERPFDGDEFDEPGIPGGDPPSDPAATIGAEADA